MRKKLIVATTAGALALGGGLAVAVPALADEESSATRQDRIRGALAGLVDDGSITDAQADEVADTLSESGLRGRGGHGGGGRLDLAAAATALDMTEDELRQALETEGTSLADVAARRPAGTRHRARAQRRVGQPRSRRPRRRPRRGRRAGRLTGVRHGRQERRRPSRGRRRPLLALPGTPYLGCPSRIARRMADR